MLAASSMSQLVPMVSSVIMGRMLSYTWELMLGSEQEGRNVMLFGGKQGLFCKLADHCNCSDETAFQPDKELVMVLTTPIVLSV